MWVREDISDIEKCVFQVDVGTARISWSEDIFDIEKCGRRKEAGQ